MGYFLPIVGTQKPILGEDRPDFGRFWSKIALWLALPRPGPYCLSCWEEIEGPEAARHSPRRTKVENYIAD